MKMQDFKSDSRDKDEATDADAALLNARLRDAGADITGLTTLNQQLTEENTALARERQILEDQLTAATQGHRESEERLRSLQDKVNSLIKKTICAYLVKLSLHIALDRDATNDINTEMIGPNKTRTSTR